MDYNQIKSYFMAREGVTVEHPYGDRADVFKVSGRKVGVLTCDGCIVNVFVKCDPQMALALRDMYHSIVPGYQFDERHWNTLIIDGRLSEELVKEQIDRSFDIVHERLRLLQHA